MKRKIILSLLAVFIISAVGAAFAVVYVGDTTSTLGQLIDLHQNEGMRQQFIISIQRVQSDLNSTPMNLDRITNNAKDLEQRAKQCSACHHSPDIAGQIKGLQLRLSDYQQALNRSISASANPGKSGKLKRKADAIGDDLLDRAKAMSARASAKLDLMTKLEMRKIERVWAILSAAVTLTFLLGALVAVRLTRSITGPISTLVAALRMIAAGDLGYTIDYKNRTEFGELAKHFNIMSRSLKNSYRKLEQEISVRAATEAVLKKSEAFLNTIFNSIDDPFCIIDRDYRIVRANEAYAQMQGMTLADLIGGTCREAFQARGNTCGECSVRMTFASGDPCAKEKEALSADGVSTWLAISTYPILDGAGNISHVIEYTRDITQRKRSEQSLQESEERYALAARGANDGLWDWDLRSSKIHYSHRWKAMLGYDEPEISEHPQEWFSRVNPDDRDELEAKVAAHIHGGNPRFEAEYRIMHRDGTFRWVLNRGLAVRNSDGQAYRMAGSQTDVTSRKKAEEQLVHDAFHDALTGLPNRALCLDRLQHAVLAMKRRPHSLYAVLFLDMDRFKIVNDSLGHTVGDLFLIAVGRKLVDCVRPGDTVARLGGDEFAVLLENIGDLGDAIDVVERIRSKMAVPLHIKGHEIFTSVSVGIALGSDRYERPEQVLRDADIAMYQAKGRGSAHYEIFDSKMHANILDRLRLESDLHGVLDRRELVLFYQPIIHLKTQRLTGFEALVRWNHPTRGLLYPREFIPLAEESGQIAAIGEWIFGEACRGLIAVQQQYPMQPPLTMSINISAKQFAQPDMADKTAMIVMEAGVDPRSLVLEITESMIMENVESAVATMHKLRDMGINIHIDDFGTGYSSLGYLHRFPVNALKIDRSFINKLTADGRNNEVILSIISLASSLNFEVIAEGVEMAHQLRNIKDLQCQYGQGYLFARPMEPGELDGWLKAEKVHAGVS